MFVFTAALVLAASLAPAAEARPRCGGEKATIVGSEGPDVLRGKSHDDVIVARGGDDQIVAGKGRDVVCAGFGDDAIDAGPNRDQALGGFGNDQIAGASGSDKLRGGDGDDALFGGQGGEVAGGGPGDDRLYGGLQDDALAGHEGNDLLIGSQGSDELGGGEGDDWLRGDTQRDSYDGGLGDDWISFASATPPYDEVDEAGAFLGLLRGGALGDDAFERVDGIENAVGSAFQDTLIGSYPAGAGGTAIGLAHRFDHCQSFREIKCGTDPRQGSEAIAFVDPSPRDPGLIVLGSAGADVWRLSVTGTEIAISGGSSLAAGPGCKPEGDLINCSAPVALGYLLAYGDGGDDTIALDGELAPGATVKLDGGRGDDQLQGGSGDEILEAGGPGSDARPSEGSDSDVLSGGEGDDALFTRPGGDVVRGGPGGDQLAADDPCGGHVFDGGLGNLDIIGFDPVNPIQTQKTRGGASSPGIVARIGGRVDFRDRKCDLASRIMDSNEILEGSQASDVLIGDAGKNGLILGGNGDDVIKGHGGPDGLRGELGSDVLLGGRGADELQAADGRKDRKLSCGPGGGRAITDSRDPRPRGCS